MRREKRVKQQQKVELERELKRQQDMELSRKQDLNKGVAGWRIR